MLDMSSKVTNVILNDKFKIKWFLFLSLNLEVESQLSELIFSSQTINFEPRSLFTPNLDPHRHEHAQEGASHFSQFSKNKQLASLFRKQPSLDRHRSIKSVTTKCFREPQAQSSMCTSANPLPSKLKDGFPVFKRIQSSCGFQVQQLQDTNARVNTRATHTYTHTHSVPKINIIKVSAKLYTCGNKVLETSRFLSLYTETFVIQLPMARILAQLRFYD